MKAVALVLLFAVCAFAYNDQPKSCGTPADHLHITKMAFYPDPIIRNKPVTVNVSATLDEALTGGNIHAVVKFLGIKIIDQNMDLCKTMEEAKYPCPIPAGPIGPYGITVTVPSAVPAGNIEVQVDIKDQNGQLVTCVTDKVTIK